MLGAMSMPDGTEYQERLVPSLWAWLAIIGFALFTYIALFVADPIVAAVTAPVVLIVGIVAAWFSAPVIRVRRGELVAAKAHIPTHLLGPATALDRAAIHKAMGVDYDPRIFACLRIGTGHALWLPVLDDTDPTPAWLISTRRPNALRAAITATQS